MQLYTFNLRLNLLQQKTQVNDEYSDPKDEKKDFLLNGGNGHIVFRIFCIVQWQVGILLLKPVP